MRQVLFAVEGRMLRLRRKHIQKGFVIPTGVRVSGRSGGICGSFYCANPPQIPRLTAFARKDKVQ